MSKNLLRDFDVERLEELINHLSFHRHDPDAPKGECHCSHCSDKRSKDYPYNRVLRWLRAHVGEPWDIVVSNFVRLEWIPVRYCFGSKLREHVETHTFIWDHEIYFYRKFSWNGAATSLKSCYNVFYVHPQTKELCFKARSKKTNWGAIERARRAKTMRVLGDYHQLLKLNGLWYEVKGKPSTSVLFNAKKYGPRDQMLFDKSSENSERSWLAFGCPEITLKKQLNTKELRYHKLANTYNNAFTRAMAKR